MSRTNISSRKVVDLRRLDRRRDGRSVSVGGGAAPVEIDTEASGPTSSGGTEGGTSETVGTPSNIVLLNEETEFDPDLNTDLVTSTFEYTEASGAVDHEVIVEFL